MLKPNKRVLFVFLAPALLTYVIVFLYPTLRTTVMSLFAVESVSDAVSKWSFNGITNYKNLFGRQLFIQSLKNIGKLWFFGGLSVMFLALSFGVILTGKLKGTKFYRRAIFLPYVVSAVALGTMWINYVYNPEYGLLHNVFFKLGFTKLSQTLWTSPGPLFWSMLAAYCFGMVGYHMLIFISGIEQIPTDYFEAAYIEGANAVQRFFHITLPGIRGVIRTNIVMWTVFTVGFFIWAQLFSPINLSSDTVAPMNYMYEQVFGSQSQARTTVRDTGAGAGVGVILMLIVIIVSAATRFIIKNDDMEV
jgi:multiple sugar transport system permease protein